MGRLKSGTLGLDTTRARRRVDRSFWQLELDLLELGKPIALDAHKSTFSILEAP